MKWFSKTANNPYVATERRTTAKKVEPSGISIKADITIITIPITPKIKGIRVADKPYYQNFRYPNTANLLR